MTTVENRTYHTLSFKDRFQIGQFLSSRLKKVDEKFVRYNDGWSDARVAATCGLPNVTAIQVAAIRKSVFGPIKPTWEEGRAVKAAKLKTAPAQIEKRLTAAEARIDILSRRTDELEDVVHSSRPEPILRASYAPPLAPTSFIPINEAKPGTNGHDS